MIFMTQKLMNKIAEKFSTEGAVNDEKEMFDVNVRSVLYGIHSVLPDMLERGKRAHYQYCFKRQL